MKKKIFLLIALLTAGTCASRAEETSTLSQEAQTSSVEVELPLYRSIYFELFGASNLIGISYDCRIRPGSPFGYRAGISYIEGTAEQNLSLGHGPVYQSTTRMRGFAIPAEVNCILGKRKSKFEVAFGLNLGLYSAEETQYYDHDVFPSHDYSHYKASTSFGYYLYSNIGYRYQRKNGFMLRVGVTPSFSFGPHGVGKYPLLYPYLSMGYTIGNK